MAPRVLKAFSSVVVNLFKFNFCTKFDIVHRFIYASIFTRHHGIHKCRIRKNKERKNHKCFK